MFSAFNSARAPLVMVAAATLAPASDWVALDQRIINESGQTRSFTLRDGGPPTEMLIGVLIQTDSAGGDRTIEPVDAKSWITVQPGQTLQLFLTRPGPKAGGRLVFDFRGDSGEPGWGFELHVASDSPKVWFQYCSFSDDKAGKGKVALTADQIRFHRENASGEDRADSDLHAPFSSIPHGQPSSLPSGGAGQGQAPSSAPGSAQPGQLPSPGSGSPGQSLPASPQGAPAESDSDDSLMEELGGQLVAFILDHPPSSPRPGASMSHPPSSPPDSADQSQVPSPDPGNASPGQFPAPGAGGPPSPPPEAKPS